MTDLAPLIDVTSVRVLARYVAELEFADGGIRVIDLEPLLWGPMFEPLVADYGVFRQVRVDRRGPPCQHCPVSSGQAPRRALSVVHPGPSGACAQGRLAGLRLAAGILPREARRAVGDVPAPAVEVAAGAQMIVWSQAFRGLDVGHTHWPALGHAAQSCTRLSGTSRNACWLASSPPNSRPVPGRPGGKAPTPGRRATRPVTSNGAPMLSACKNCGADPTTTRIRVCASVVTSSRVVVDHEDILEPRHGRGRR